MNDLLHCVHSNIWKHNICVFMCLYVCLCVCMPVCLCVSMSACVCVCMPVCMCVSMSACLCVCRPDGYSYHEFRTQFVVFSIYLSKAVSTSLSVL